LIRDTYVNVQKKIKIKIEKVGICPSASVILSKITNVSGIALL